MSTLLEGGMLTLHANHYPKHHKQYFTALNIISEYKILYDDYLRCHPTGNHNIINDKTWEYTTKR